MSLPSSAARQARDLAHGCPLEMVQHEALTKALDIWIATGRIGNMGTERLLALIRKAAPAKCVVERLLASGFLTQLQSKHLAAGGHDVRKTTRRRLLDKGAPLRAGRARGRSVAPSAASRSHSSGFSAFATRRIQMQRQDGGGRRMTRAEYRAFMQTVSAEWVQLSPEVRAAFAAQGRGRRPHAVAGGQAYDDKIGSSL